MTATQHESASLVRRVLKVKDNTAVVPIGDGSDHWAFTVDQQFVARVRKLTDEHTAAAVEREAALMDLVARVSPIPVPVVVAAAPASGLLVFRRLPGTSLLDQPPSDPLAFAEPLAHFVASLHAVGPAAVEHLVERDEYQLEAYWQEARQHVTRVAACLTSEQRRRVDQFLASPPPPGSASRVFCHNDLGAEHLLASDDGSQLTGVIDWSDAAIADPARDVGRLLRDFGFDVAEVVLRRTGGDDRTRMRATCYARCALLEDLAYGVERSRPRYIAHALGRFAETFS